MNDLPKPLTPADCDCTDLDSFMLNVERLMASELVALSSLEVIGAALLLWSRAWKQKPAASLPDDERVIAAFAKLSVSRFRKLREEVLRGFVKCADGRLYHRTLSAEAVGAYERKIAFRKKRETDADRLRKWRETTKETRHETPGETGGETQSETRFVAEGQGQGQGHKKHSAPRFDAQAHLESFGVPTDLARDWLSVRKAKRLAPTATAFDAAKAEADAAGISLADALRTCVVRGWGGFKASWLTDGSGRVNGHADDNPFA